jgi:hypothetical protein
MNHEQIKQRICKLLCMTDAQYAEHQYNTGLSYLQLYIRNNAPIIRELEGNKIFWAWWRNQWAMRDAKFLAAKHPDNMMAIWLNCHDAAMLATERYPSAKILGRSYAAMIGKVIKEEVQQ